jgi:hypothetical protein
MAVHKLIFNTKAIKDPENQKQITRITDRRGSLKHDDRVDILASAVAYWQDSLSIDADSQIEKNKQEEYKQQLKEWMSNKRALGLLGERISGAILLNGSDQYMKKVFKPVVKKRFKT